MFLDIAFAFLIALGYIIAIVMASKSNKATEITLSEKDIELIAQKVADKIKLSNLTTNTGSHTHFGSDLNFPSNVANPTIVIDEAPVVLKSKTEGMELLGAELGKEETSNDKISTSKLATLKGKK